MLFYPVATALLHMATMSSNVLRTASEGSHVRNIFTGLVHTDPVVATHHSILDSSHFKNSSTLTQTDGQNLAFDVFILMVILRTI